MRQSFSCLNTFYQKCDLSQDTLVVLSICDQNLTDCGVQCICILRPLIKAFQECDAFSVSLTLFLWKCDLLFFDKYIRTATSVVVPLTAYILLRVHWRAFDTACFWFRFCSWMWVFFCAYDLHLGQPLLELHLDNRGLLNISWHRKKHFIRSNATGKYFQLCISSFMSFACTQEWHKSSLPTEKKDQMAQTQKPSR